jgi:hypothetical protein
MKYRAVFHHAQYDMASVYLAQNESRIGEAESAGVTSALTPMTGGRHVPSTSAPPSAS